MLDAYGIKDNGDWYPIKISFVGQKLCGSGRFSNVYCSQLTSPVKKDVAVKNVWSDNENSSMKTMEYPEVLILSKIFHPAISNLLYFYTRNSNNKMIHCLVLDYMPSEMSKLKEKGVKFDLLDAKMYSYQLFSAISYLASKQIVHMDIKPQNIVLNEATGLLKLADFGNARRLDTSEKSGPSYQVTRFYRPPELLLECANFTTSIDVWSATCVSFEFFANRTLFKGKDSKDQIMLITTVLGYPTDEDIKSIGVRRPRVARREARGIETFTSNALDKDIYDLLKCTLLIDPKKRKPASEILKMPLFEVVKTTKTTRSNGVQLPDMGCYGQNEHKRSDVEEKESDSSNEDDK